MVIETVTVVCMNGIMLDASEGSIHIRGKRQTETVRIDQLQTFAIKEPKGISPGRITFSTAKAATFNVAVAPGVGVALGGEHSFMFSSSALREAREFEEYVHNWQNRTSASPAPAEDKPAAPEPASGISMAGQIRELKQLLDEGILTEEEFTAGKRRILGIQ